MRCDACGFVHFPNMGVGAAVVIRNARGQVLLNMTTLLRFLRDDKGATAIEYGLIAAGISVAIIATVAGLGSKLNTTFGSVQGALN